MGNVEKYLTITDAKIQIGKFPNAVKVWFPVLCMSVRVYILCVCVCVYLLI